MIKAFEAKEYISIAQRQGDVNEARFHRSFDFLKEITIKLLTSLLLLNGGAIVASLTFLGTLINNPGFTHIDRFTTPLLCFAIGSALTVLLCGITYCSQSYYTAAIASGVAIHDMNQYKLLNQQKIEFYIVQGESIDREEERSILNRILESLYKNDASYESKIGELVKNQECEECKGDWVRCGAVILFFICLGLFFRGVYLMGLIFYNL